jgi:hypothetical protein
MPQQSTSLLNPPKVRRVETYTVKLADGTIVTRTKKQLTKLPPGAVTGLVVK